MVWESHVFLVFSGTRVLKCLSDLYTVRLTQKISRKYGLARYSEAICCLIEDQSKGEKKKVMWLSKEYEGHELFSCHVTPSSPALPANPDVHNVEKFKTFSLKILCRKAWKLVVRTRNVGSLAVVKETHPQGCPVLGHGKLSGPFPSWLKPESSQTAPCDLPGCASLVS